MEKIDQRRTTRHWKTVINTARPLPGFGRLRTVGSETELAAVYRSEGALRGGESHMVFQYSLAGEGIFERNGKVYPVPPGSGFLCAVSDPGICYYYPPEADEPWRFIWVSFDGEQAVAMSRDLIERHGSVLALSADCTAMQQITQVGQADAELTMTAAESARLVTELLLALATEAEPAVSSTPSAEWTRRARKVIAESLHLNINIKDIANQLGVSREHLTRVFREETGGNLHDYLLREKIVHACHLLKETKLPHNEISSQLGYGSGAHFSRAFKHVMRMTPREFRRVGIIPNG